MGSGSQERERRNLYGFVKQHCPCWKIKGLCNRFGDCLSPHFCPCQVFQCYCGDRIKVCTRCRALWRPAFSGMDLTCVLFCDGLTTHQVCIKLCLKKSKNKRWMYKVIINANQSRSGTQRPARWWYILGWVDPLQFFSAAEKWKPAGIRVRRRTRYPTPP